MSFIPLNVQCVRVSKLLNRFQAGSFSSYQQWYHYLLLKIIFLTICTRWYFSIIASNYLSSSISLPLIISTNDSSTKLLGVAASLWVRDNMILKWNGIVRNDELMMNHVTVGHHVWNIIFLLILLQELQNNT